MGLHINLGQNISFTFFLDDYMGILCSSYCLSSKIMEMRMYHDTAFSFPFAALSEWRAVAVITWSLIMPQHYARARVFYSMIASRIALKGNFSIIYGNISISIFPTFTVQSFLFY